jgi:hypothetical protein
MVQMLGLKSQEFTVRTLLGRGEKRAEFPRCFRTLVVKIEKTNSNSTRDCSKRINFTRVDLLFGQLLS